MSEQPTTAPQIEEGTNAFVTVAQRPRLLLLMLAGWSILGVLTETFTSSGLFLDGHNRELDGALGGFALGWEGIPLAALYIYCFRNPERYHSIFVLALIHMGALCASQLYHWVGTSDFTFESIVIPLAGSGLLGVLCFIHMFQPRQEPAQVED
jgi:hypothetical protein